MDEAMGVREALTQVYEQLFQFVVDFVPRLATGVLVLLVGVILAKLLAWILRGTLTRIRFDTGMERIGITEMLKSVGLKGSLSSALSKLLYYLLVILFVRGAAQSVGLMVISSAIDSFFSYLPRLVAALLILLLGNLVGQFVRTMVEQSTAESGVEYAPALGRAVSGAILFIVAIMAISQLGIDTAMIRTVVIAVLAGGAGAFALSFGLGTREITRNIVAGFYVRKLFRIGDPIEVTGERGVLSAITPTKTLLDRDGQAVSVSNSRMMDENVKQ